MEVSVKELRIQPGRIISMVEMGNAVTITVHGRPAAKIVPLDYPAEAESAGNELPAFGMWKDREDMSNPSGYVAKLRKESGM